MQQTVQQRPFAAPAAPTRRAAPRAARGLATGNGAGPLPVQAKLAEGARIKVTAPIKVYHVGKFKSGLELQGLEAVVVQPDVRDFKYKDGKQHELSANLPVKVGAGRAVIWGCRGRVWVVEWWPVGLAEGWRVRQCVRAAAVLPIHMRLHGKGGLTASNGITSLSGCCRCSS